MKRVDFHEIIRYFNFHGSSGDKRVVFRDWKIINIFFAVVFVLAVIADGYVAWVNLKKLNDDTVAVNGKSAVINKESLNSALEKIKKRQTQFEDKTSAPATKDPSM